MQNRMLAIAAFDSQFKVVSHIAESFSQAGWEIDIKISRVRSKQLSDRRVEAFSSFSSVDYCSSDVGEILGDWPEYKAIMIILEGRITQRITQAFY